MKDTLKENCYAVTGIKTLPFSGYDIVSYFKDILNIFENWSCLRMHCLRRETNCWSTPIALKDKVKKVNNVMITNNVTAL